MRSRRSFLLVVLFVLIGMAGLNGCSAFQSKRKMDMAPFSENTGVLFAEAAKVSRPFEFKHLRPYLDIPEYRNSYGQAKPLLIALRGVVYYSNQVVAINNARMSDKEKNQHLARYLSEVIETARVKKSADSALFGEVSVDSVLQDIRAAKTYLDGIAAAGPLVNAVVVAIQRDLDDFQQDVVPGVVAGFDREIEADVAVTRGNYSDLKALQARSMRAANLFYLGRMGDPASLKKLIEEDPSVKDLLPSPEKATAKQMDATEQYLIERLKRIDDVIHQLDYDVANYNAKRDELETWRRGVEEKIKVARQAITIWAQSHRNLGNGIPVPPMIDIGEITGSVVGTAKKAVF